MDVGRIYFWCGVVVFWGVVGGFEYFGVVSSDL